MLPPAPEATITSLTSIPNLDLHRWVIQIREILEEGDIEDDNDSKTISVCISNVPKSLKAHKPDAYIPQQISLGPYHHWRPELYEMGRYKLEAAKRRQKQLMDGLKFQHLVEGYLTKLDLRIRSCYHKYIDFNCETLAWLMAVDASFLLEFLQIFAIKEGKLLPKVSFRMLHLVDYSGRRSAHNAILRDVMMLENQIPLFLIRRILEVQYSSLETADDILCSMIRGLFKEISPFKITLEDDDYFSSNGQDSVTGRVHLLDCLYYMLVRRKSEEMPSVTMINESDNDQSDNGATTIHGNEESNFANTSNVKTLIHEIWTWLKKLNRETICLLKNATVSRPVTLVAILTILTHLPCFSLFKLPIQNLFFYQENKNMKPESDGPNKNLNKPPLVEEITIPSVTELFKSGVRFSATDGNIETIRFDEKTVTLFLPAANLDINSEVILRNLVAYEASTASGPLVFTHYTELMNGVIDTAGDAKLLRESGILLNRLKSDEEVANLWNGMSKSVRITKVPLLDKVILDINKYYDGNWKVRVTKFMKNYVFNSWRFLTLLAATLLLLLIALQAFFTLYSHACVFTLKKVQ
ncbi:hypothetical protein MKX01_001194 [Papaver californicum]|nr:hypothetical protein MKX01_001194 [Papaver californicum]